MRPCSTTGCNARPNHAFNRTREYVASFRLVRMAAHSRRRYTRQRSQLVGWS
jgi:hypothetical protein